jgi:hypothetical protein
MPFQSEKQRRYLWANEPEIARDWADTYGSRVEKSNGGIMNWAGQGGMKNYLGEQPMVSAPKYWQSAPDHEMTELAYITPKEKDVLVDMNMYGSMQGEPNEGPSGIMSLNGWGSSDSSQNRAGADISSSMDTNPNDRGWSRPGGFTSPAAKSPAELKAIADRKFSNTVMPSSFYGKQYKAPKGSNSFGGGIRNLLSFINPLNLLGGFIDNPIMRGIFSGVVNNAGKFKKGMNEFSQYDNLADYLNRNKQGVETVDIRDKFNRKNNKETMTADFNFHPSQGGIVNTEVADDNLDFINNSYMAKVTGPALIQMRNLEKKQGMEPFGGTPLNENELNQLKQLKEMDQDQDNTYSSIIT